MPSKQFVLFSVFLLKNKVELKKQKSNILTKKKKKIFYKKKRDKKKNVK